MSDIKLLAKKIISLTEEIKKYEDRKKNLQKIVLDLKQKTKNEEEYETQLNKLLKGRTIEGWESYFNSYIKQLLTEIDIITDDIIKKLEGDSSSNISTPIPVGYNDNEITKKPETLKEAKTDQTILPILNKEEKNKLIRELNIDKEYLERLMPREKDDDEIVSFKEYTVYEVNPYGKIANKYMEKLTEKLIKLMPEEYEKIVNALRTSDSKILSKTYVSMMIFSAILASIGSATLILSILIIVNLSSLGILKIIQIFVQSVAFSWIIGAITLGGFYFYPIIQANNRKRQIKNDLPFVIIHMSAVAGSGAHPISMFNLLLNSKEYPGLEGEVKKIINYVNLFGYNLTTALRTVALTTPSERFRDLLNGFITTIEGGGSLKRFLDSKAEEAMNTYNLERKKYVESLSTYFDMYTGILIAAPLLFFVTIAIIQMLGGSIMGLSVEILAIVGTYVILPLLNIGFFIFVNLIEPE